VPVPLTTTYHYDARNRLTRVDLPDGTVASYAYDPFGRRVKKQVGSAITLFVYADEGLVGEYDGAGMMRKLYGWKPDGLWGTDPLYMVEGGNYYFYQNDHLGTPQRLTSAADGAVVWGAGYLAFGAVVVDPSSAVENNLRFPGQYADAETGLYYNFQRYYDPVRGRYTQVDPIGFAGGDVNLYGYAERAPLNLIDPHGLLTEVIITRGTWYGHAAISVDGVVYSNGRYNRDSVRSLGLAGDNILLRKNHSDYINYYNNKKIDSVGFVLELTNEDETKIKKFFDELINKSEKWKYGYKLPEDYFFTSDNCTTNVVEALQEALSFFNDLWVESFSPYQLEFHLRTAPWLVKDIIYYSN
jgi:RHS repeat-associated protein